jgi:hypothetical protein
MSWRRRAAIGGVLTAVTLVLSAFPAPAAQLTNVHVVAGTRIPSVDQFIPKFGFGDEDFAGHGPDVFTSAEFRIGLQSPRNLHVFLCMEAEETRPDFTRVNECMFFLIFQAPPGECVVDVRRDELQPIGYRDELKYRDTNHDLDTFDGQVHDSFVQKWEVTGDTLGNEAKTETGVNLYTHRLIVTTDVNTDRCR